MNDILKSGLWDFSRRWELLPPVGIVLPPTTHNGPIKEFLHAYVKVPFVCLIKKIMYLNYTCTNVDIAIPKNSNTTWASAVLALHDYGTGGWVLLKSSRISKGLGVERQSSNFHEHCHNHNRTSVRKH